MKIKSFHHKRRMCVSKWRIRTLLNHDLKHVIAQGRAVYVIFVAWSHESNIFKFEENRRKGFIDWQ